MNITEGNALNVLLSYVLDLSGTSSDDDAREAAEYLADRANKTLGAGLTAATVRASWPEADEPLVWPEVDPPGAVADVADHPFVSTERVPGWCTRCGCSPMVHPWEHTDGTPCRSVVAAGLDSPVCEAHDRRVRLVKP